MSIWPGLDDGDGFTEASLPSADELFGTGPVASPEDVANEVRRSTGARHAPRPERHRDGPDVSGLMRWLGLE